MHHLYRHDLEVTDMKWLMWMDLVQTDGRHTRIAVLGKAIGQHLQHRLLSQGIGIDVNLTKLTIWPDIIHTSHVVVMRMGNQDAVDLTERLGQDLLTEIRATVYQQTCLIRFHQYRTACTLVLGVCALAHITLTADDRHATRCSRSQKRQFHLFYLFTFLPFLPLYDVHFRIDVDVKLGLDILTDGFAEGYNL